MAQVQQAGPLLLQQHRALVPIIHNDMALLAQVDADLAGCEALQAVPRLVYGMLRCALMTQRPGQHPDQRVALKHLWGSLPPREIRCALYPTLSSFSDLDTLVGVPSPSPQQLTPPQLFLPPLLTAHESGRGITGVSVRTQECYSSSIWQTEGHHLPWVLAAGEQESLTQQSRLVDHQRTNLSSGCLHRHLRVLQRQLSSKHPVPTSAQMSAVAPDQCHSSTEARLSPVVLRRPVHSCFDQEWPTWKA